MRRQPFLEALTPAVCFNQPENKDKESSCSVHGNQAGHIRALTGVLLSFSRTPHLINLRCRCSPISGIAIARKWMKTLGKGSHR
jgi:hypothetical protein